MKSIHTYPKIVILSLGIILFSSCRDLTENNPSDITSLQREEHFIAALGEAYTSLGFYGGDGSLFLLQELSSDELVAPQRGPDWIDGGLVEAHRHTITNDQPAINNTWNDLFSGVNATSRLILQFETLKEDGSVSAELADDYIAEMKVLRGFYYFWLLDTYGNVPIIDDFSAIEGNPPNNADFQSGRNELFSFIESEIQNNIGLISDDPSSAYGRMHQDAAHFLLAKLYLNAESYTGTPRWNDALTHLNEIINSGNFSLTADYFESFKAQNSNSPEIIFAIPYDEVFLGGFLIHVMSLHYEHQKTYDFQVQPWNGYAAQADFYRSFNDNDVRKEGFIVGPQYDINGNSLIDPVIATGHHLDIKVDMSSARMTEPESRETGARLNKFEYEIGAGLNLNNDFPVFRFADVVLMKAEVLWRLGQSNSEALMLLNMTRNRADVEPYTEITADNILAERGRELYTEVWRRQDLIRFPGINGGETRFNDPWWDKETSDVMRNVFPIPQNQLDANPNLTQNPGY